jgi:hypothetical protein
MYIEGDDVTISFYPSADRFSEHALEQFFYHCFLL